VKPIGTILLLADRRQSQTAKMLRNAGYRLVTTFSPHHAVAICVNNHVDVVVLDQQHFIVTENWSVAQSLKMIKPSVCVILVVRGKLVGADLPQGVDAVVSDGDHSSLTRNIKRLIA